MIDNNLHKNPVALDRERHRDWKLDREKVDLAPLARLNSFFINVAEFGDACLEYPIVFVPAADNGGKRSMAPVAAFGLAPGENLFVDGGRWIGEYVPAHLRVYPFAVARTGEDSYAVCADADCKAINPDKGEALFGADGQPTPYLLDVQKYLEAIEVDFERTRVVCARLLELDLMQDMRFEATLPDGNKVTVDGFLALDEKKFAALPDAAVVELHRNGILGLLNAHQISMRNMRRLVDRRLRRTATA